MKKLIVAILSLLYICTSTGATVHMHYCMGKLADWDFGHNTSKTCSGCGMKKLDKGDNGCCKDEHKFLKSNGDQKTIEPAFSLLQLVSVAPPASFIEIPSGDLPAATEAFPVSHAPPRSDGVAVYVRNCLFLI